VTERRDGRPCRNPLVEFISRNIVFEHYASASVL
jgi:hypothetical protein